MYPYCCYGKLPTECCLSMQKHRLIGNRLSSRVWGKEESTMVWGSSFNIIIALQYKYMWDSSVTIGRGIKIGSFHLLKIDIFIRRLII